MRTPMARFLAFTAAFIGTFAGKVLSQEGRSVALAFSGDFLGVRSVPETNQVWFAVNQTQTGMALSETRVEVTQVPSACSGTATRISAIDISEPLFLVRGSPITS